MTDISSYPIHVGFIMDGNGRWAKKHGLSRNFGHEAGAKTLENVIDLCKKYNLECATFYAFSSENWSRPKEEVDALMNLFDKYIADLCKRIKAGKLEAFRSMKLKFIGDLSFFSDEMKSRITEVEALTVKPEKQSTVNIAINYGGRNEIVSAVNRFISENPGKPIDIDSISRNLYTKDNGDPDLIIRTAGEMRLSNFLLWQAAYAEFYSTPVLWPDFSEKDFIAALEEFSKRTRKFGGIKE